VITLDSVRERPDPRAAVPETVIRRQAFEAALAGLAPEDRAAVLLVDAQGLGYRDAAEVLGVPEGTVASRLNRARAQLRRELTDRLEGASGR
jgi:RNA polymerase sigma-70 factor (ECF subfamily)